VARSWWCKNAHVKMAGDVHYYVNVQCGLTANSMCETVSSVCPGDAAQGSSAKRNPRNTGRIRYEPSSGGSETLYGD